MSLDIAKLIAEGKTPDQIKNIVSAAIAEEQEKIEAAKPKIATLEEIGGRVAAGILQTEDIVILLIDYMKQELPEIADLGEIDLNAEDISFIADAVDEGIAEGRKQLAFVTQLAKAADPTGSNKIKLTPEDAMRFLGQFKTTL